MQVGLRPFDGPGKPVAGIDGSERSLDELGLAAVAMRRHHHAAGQRIGHVGAEVVGHDVQAEIDGRCAPGRGEDEAVIDIEHRRVDTDQREPAG